MEFGGRRQRHPDLILVVRRWNRTVRLMIVCPAVATQFMSYTRMHPVSDVKALPGMFVVFINNA